MSKATMQGVADSLGVSRITVWKALNNRPGVSEDLRRRIIREAAERGVGVRTMSIAQQAQERTVSVVVSRPESSSFWMQIIHHIAKELSNTGVNLMYTYMPSAYKPGFQLPPSLSRDSVAGFIVLNIYDAQLLSLLSESPLPKVFLDTVPTLPASRLNGDLVLLEGRSRIREITGKLLRTGRKTLGFIGDVGYAQTNTDRYMGFLDAHEQNGVEPSQPHSWTAPLHLRNHYDEISQFLSRMDRLPDAIVCASDFIAHFVKKYLAESGRQVPDSFVLTGYDNNVEYQNVAEQITTVDVETSSLGSRLASKVLYRADHPTASYEVSYVTSSILYRAPLKDAD